MKIVQKLLQRIRITKDWNVYNNRESNKNVRKRDRREVTVINDCVDTNDDYCKHDEKWFFRVPRFVVLYPPRLFSKLKQWNQFHYFAEHALMMSWKDDVILNINEFAKDLFPKNFLFETLMRRATGGFHDRSRGLIKVMSQHQSLVK